MIICCQSLTVLSHAGSLLLQNGTHALWEWHRNQDAVRVTADAVWIVRSETCTVGVRSAGARLAGAPTAGSGFGRRAGPWAAQGVLAQ